VRSFDHYKPISIAESVAVLARQSEARLLAGGMTLLPTMKQRLATPAALVDLAGIADLKGIAEDGRAITIAAMTRHADVARSNLVMKRIPALAALASSIGDPQVRNRGTLGGSIANNDPAADYPAAVLGLGGTIETDRRQIAADEFFLGLFETALHSAEIITSVRFPVPDRAGYAKFRNPASRYAIVGVFVAQFGTSVRVAVTGAAPCVFRANALEAALEGRFAVEALTGLSIDPWGFNSDLHASAAYRAHLVMVFARQAVAAALSQAQ
jgi:carbon-monoxide dehydrogenase medium subunit